jgi:hypothetical protein
MKINIEYTEKELKELIINDLHNKFNVVIDEKKLDIMVKSKQNYKSEWEKASYKATYDHYPL